jgi:ubiquinone/menaquinone biosynthesis C-methylase UbiE
MVVDLAAGTGKLGRLLVASGARVVAVEPVEAMRELIPSDLEVIAGTAEAMPVPSRTADAVVVGQAFQWFDTDAALTEIHRVLRPRGGLAIVRNRRDVHDPVQRAFEEVLRRHRSHPSLEATLDVETALRATRHFELREQRTFPNEYELDSQDLVALAASETSIALLEGRAHAAALADFRLLAEPLPARLRLRYTTEIHIADRSAPSSRAQ